MRVLLSVTLLILFEICAGSYYTCSARIEGSSGDTGALSGGDTGPYTKFWGCGWYQYCMESAYPCENSLWPYAITYGLIYCEMFENRGAKFNAEGRQWIISMRSCLINHIEPFVSNFSHSSLDASKCEELQTSAYDSQAACYLRTGVCNMQTTDWFQALWTIKSAIVSEPWDSLRQLWDAISHCVDSNHRVKRSADLLPKFQIHEKFKILSFTAQVNLFHPVPGPDVLAREFAELLSQMQNWEETTIDWVAFGEMGFGIEMNIKIIFTDTDLVNSLTANATNFNQSMTRLLMMLETPEIVTAENWQLVEAHVCDDITCQETVTELTTDSASSTESTLVRASTLQTTQRSSSLTSTGGDTSPISNTQTSTVTSESPPTTTADGQQSTTTTTIQPESTTSRIGQSIRSTDSTTQLPTTTTSRTENITATVREATTILEDNNAADNADNTTSSITTLAATSAVTNQNNSMIQTDNTSQFPSSTRDPGSDRPPNVIGDGGNNSRMNKVNYFMLVMVFIFLLLV